MLASLLSFLLFLGLSLLLVLGLFALVVLVAAVVAIVNVVKWFVCVFFIALFLVSLSCSSSHSCCSWSYNFCHL